MWQEAEFTVIVIISTWARVMALDCCKTSEALPRWFLVALSQIACRQSEMTVIAVQSRQEPTE